MKQSQSTASTSCARGHMVFKPKCPCCSSFKKDWYHQLEMAGFTDIESREHLHNYNYQVSKLSKLSKGQEQLTACISYYRWVSETATHASFKSEMDRKIWQLHADGHTQQRIEELVCLDQSRISRRIKNIKSYLLTQTIGSLTVEVSA